MIIMRGLPGSGKSHVAKLIRVSGFSDRSLNKSIHLIGLNVETLSFTWFRTRKWTAVVHLQECLVWTIIS